MQRFRIGYVGFVPHPNFLATAAQDPALEIVHIPLEASTGEQIQALSSCHGYYVMAARDELPLPLHVHAELLGKLPNLLMAASYGAGYDPCNPEACTDAGVLLVNQAGGNAEGVAEHAVGMMLACLKRMPEAQASMIAGTARNRATLLGRELRGKVVGLVGFGHVGRRVAEIVKAAFGNRVLVSDPYLDAATIAAHGGEKVDFATLLAQSDVVSIHCPLTPETRGMINAAAYAAMKKGVIFVTTARGSIHDEAALFEALESGQVASAGLDVWEVEPPPVDHPLLHHRAVIASQHTAGVTEESRANITKIAALAFSELAAGRMPPRIVNPEVKPRFIARYTAAFGKPPVG
ncbi:3-phosphoglycerate dehydrogenase [Roseococcus sp. SDR]|uniref:NAD(P)-dependent oxidoreductase n=1 Tax=Roseococcus sp. SDR TaxID=2835532 RepID=UPI001BCF289E|nr:NAD(P)-dependent oxidoreductase [Roseococcus sp. SDR]MBS7789026.1 3-phosphoglycerate dehydrogenase [Roseococcus sp. SDR]MBV1844340.1 3-phosphoglycerate dehydrogenase [Roseococcus sp. SDR]